MESGPDAQPSPDAQPELDSAVFLVDATPQPDASSPPCGGETFLMRDLPGNGSSGSEMEFALGLLRAEVCSGEVDQSSDAEAVACEPADLYVSALGLGVDGTLIGGDPFAGYDRITLTLGEPRRIEYAIGGGEDYADGEGDFIVRHWIRAYRMNELVYEATPEGKEYVSSPLPAADRIVWSPVEPPGPYFADAVSITSMTGCPTPAEVSWHDRPLGTNGSEFYAVGAAPPAAPR
jgi:hypothetical protein